MVEAKVKKTTKTAIKKVPNEPKGTKEPKVKATTAKNVIPAKAGIQEKSGSRIKSGMTGSKVEGSLKVAVYDLSGKETRTTTLPAEVFGAKVNPVLMAQAVRVYLANQRVGSANTKTRGEVDGSTKKIYRQKGTGRARHGGITAPIFVGGGTAHGPKLRDYSLTLNKKMRKAALLSALSQMAKEGLVKVVAGMSKIEPKTKVAAKAFAEMGVRKALLVMPEHTENVFKAARNLDRVTVTNASQLSTYAVLNAGTLVLMEETLESLEKTFKA